MFRACTRWLLAVLLVVLSSASAWTTEVPPGMVRLPGHVLPTLSHATKVQSATDAGSKPITLTIVLKHDDETGFAHRLHDTYDEHSKDFHHFLSQLEIADRFGPSRSEYQQLSTYLRKNGFEVIERSKNRLTLTARGTRARAESAFNVSIDDYRSGKTNFYANDRDPELPAQVASSVQAVVGLSDLARPRQDVETISYWIGVFICKAAKGIDSSFDLKNCITNVKTTSKYNGPDAKDPPGWEELDGTGQTIGLIEFDTFRTSDVADFLNLIGAPATQINNLSEIKVNGGATPGPNQDEVLLDIDDVMTIAPGAKVVVVDQPFAGAGASFQSLFNAEIDGGATVISNSWAYCEDQTDAADVQSLDLIFQNAEIGGTSIFNGSGDNGSSCLDGSANTVSVPADSPNATAVGGSSLNDSAPGNTYGTETWWNGSAASPPTGQGGFGFSRFFSAPTYQTGTMRSVPDVVANADPAYGTFICQASAGGCPNSSLYGGTSSAAPQWGAFAAILNQGLGHNIGAFNQAIYPFANTNAFHNAASMGSDFAHVGLGSPNLNLLFLSLSGQTVGTPSAALSQLFTYLEAPTPSSSVNFFADGATKGYVTVRLLDANSNPVSGKTVSLTANSGSQVQISQSSGVSTVDNGTVVFTLTDLVPENITLTATTDGITLSTTPQIAFVTPPATSAGINSAPNSVNNDGKSITAITVTLKDSLGRPTPGKLINLSQTGSSVISGPSPPVTDVSGNIQFTATDIVAETVTYTAVDVTDVNLPVPGSAVVTFTGGPTNTCGSGLPPAAPGFVVTPYATGFSAQSITTGGDGGINFGCQGATGIAFDSSGNLYVNEFPTGNIYKFPPGGGAAGPSTQLNSTSLGVTLSGLAFDSSGNLFASLDLTSASATTGAVIQLNPSNGTMTRTISPGLSCPTTISIDPLSGDLFTDDTCTGFATNDSVWRIASPGGASPSTSVYTALPAAPNATLAFAPGGTIYAWAFTGSEVNVAQISGTNGPTPPTVSVLPGLQLSNLGLLAGGTGNGTFLIATPFVNNAVVGIDNVDLTTSPPTLGTSFATTSGANFMTFGPDGCIYAAQGTTVFKITDTSGGCSYGGTSLASPTLVLSPTAVSPNPAQGTSQTFDAMLHYANAPAGTQVAFTVSGANPQTVAVNTNSNGLASFSYSGVRTGQDTITAVATVGTSVLTSNQSVVTWGTGLHSTFLGINQSPTTGTPGQTANLLASLTDISVNPVAALSGQTIQFGVDGANCSNSTNPSGIAACQVTVGAPGSSTLTASFAGTSSYLASSASTGFNVLAPVPVCTTLGNARNFALESVGGDVTTGGNASIGKGTSPPGSVAGLNVSLGNSSGVGQNAISSSSALVLGTNTSVSGACVTGGSGIMAGSATRCGSIDTTGTSPLLTTYSKSGTDASAFETAVINATATQSIGGFTLAIGGTRTLTDSVVGGFNLVRINGNVVLNNSSSLTLAGAAGDTLVVDITGNLSLGTNSHIQLSGLSPNQVVIKVRGAISNWGDSSSINGTLLAVDGACAAGINDSVTGAVICGRDATFGSSLRVGFNPATNVCVPEASRSGKQ